MSKKISRSAAVTMLSGGCAVLALTLGSAATAQEAPVPAAGTAEISEPANEMGDIVVTANRRAQNSQDVGIAITAFGEEALSRMSVSNATDISLAVPNLRFTNLGGAVINFNIRGVSQNDFADHLEPPVAIYVDDSYLSTTTQASLPIFDLDRVEVLRGPQGTLFGRNATGGLIHFISKQPTDHFEGYVDATLADDVWGKVEGAVGGPLGNNVQGRIAFSVSSRDGFVKNATDGTKLGNEHYAALRGILTFQPSSNVDVSLTLRYTKNFDQSGGAYAFTPTIAGPNGLGRFVGPNENPYGTCNGCGAPFYGTYTQNNPYKGAYNMRGNFARDAYDATLKIEADLGFAQFASITDYQYLNKAFHEDVDATPVNVAETSHGQKLDHATQEFRLSGTSDRFDWTTGIYLFYQNSRTETFFSILGGLGPIPEYTAKMKTYSAAFYAQGDYKITDNIDFILGGRYTYDRKKDNYFLSDANFPGAPLNFNPSTFPGLADKKYNLYSAKAEVQWKPVNRLMFYASFNRGTKGGGFNTPGFLPVVPASLPFRDETLYAYEIGEKWTSDDGKIRLNASAFYYNYKNYQAYAFRTLNGNPVGTILNRDATVKGAEVDLTLYPTDGLSINVSPSYLDTKVKNVQLPDGAIVDRKLPQAPKWSGNASLRYEWPVLGDKTAAFQFDVSYNSKQNYTVLAAPDELESSYAVGSLRLSLAKEGEWEAAVFAKNLWNQKYRIFAFDLSALGTIAQSYARPRTIGLQFRHNFR